MTEIPTATRIWSGNVKSESNVSQRKKGWTFSTNQFLCCLPWCVWMLGNLGNSPDVEILDSILYQIKGCFCRLPWWAERRSRYPRATLERIARGRRWHSQSWCTGSNPPTESWSAPASRRSGCRSALISTWKVGKETSLYFVWHARFTNGGCHTQEMPDGTESLRERHKS